MSWRVGAGGKLLGVVAGRLRGQQFPKQDEP